MLTGWVASYKFLHGRAAGGWTTDGMQDGIGSSLTRAG
jgi:hypothetical protein